MCFNYSFTGEPPDPVARVSQRPRVFTRLSAKGQRPAPPPYSNAEPDPAPGETPESSDVHDGHYYGITRLTEGPDANYNVDIIAVHGLGGHAMNTWTHSETNKNWLRDFLPEQIPTARVMVFGYNAGVVNNGCVLGIMENAENLLQGLYSNRNSEGEKSRRIIFIGHSLGGIVIKKALIIAKHEERFKPILLATIGVMFMGVPHGGSDLADLAQRIKFIAQVTVRVNDININSLVRGSESLQSISRDFGHIEGPKIVTVMESETTWIPHTGRRLLVVPKDSARLGLGSREIVFSITGADHHMVCKFKSKDDRQYFIVWTTLKELVDEQIAGPHSSGTPEPMLEIFRLPLNVPFVQNQSFVGRLSELGKLHQTLNDPTDNGRKIAVLYGTGGIGKTQIAVEYIYQHYESYSSIFWINASRLDTLQKSFVDAAKQLVDETAKRWQTAIPDYGLIARDLRLTGILEEDGRVTLNESSVGKIIDAVVGWLAEGKSSSWLLVFDNVDDLDTIDIEKYFPRSKSGNIIVTSRRPESKRFATKRGDQEIDKLDAESALTLLLRSAGKDDLDTTDNKTRDDASVLVKELYYFPLAIDQAGAYIDAHPITFEEYLNRHKTRFKDLASERPSGPWRYEYTVFTTWETSFEALETGGFKKATNLLLLCSFIHNEDILSSIFYRGFDFADGENTFEKDMAKLLSYSLIKKGTPGSYWIHPLVHSWGRERLSSAGRSSRVREALKVLGGALEHKDQKSMEDWEFERRVLPHIQQCMQNFKEFETDAGGTISRLDDLALLDNISRIAEAFYEQGRYGKAEALFWYVLESREVILGPEDPKTLRTVSSLASAMEDLGHYSVAETLFRRVFDAREKVLDPEDPLMLGTIHNLAIVIANLGRYDEAEILFRRVMEARERLLGREDLDTLRTVHSMANTIRDRGNYSDAENLYRRVLEARERLLGRENPETLHVVGALANAMTYQGHYDEAELMYKRVIGVGKKLLGLENPEVLGTMHNLANAIAYQGRYSEAETLYRSVLVANEKLLGPQHPHTLGPLQGLALVRADQGFYSEGEAMCRKVVEENERLLGPDHPDTLGAVHNLTSIMNDLKCYSEAETLCRRVVEANERLLGPDHPDTLRTLHALAIVMRGHGNPSDAETILRRVMDAKPAAWERLQDLAHGETMSLRIVLARPVLKKK